MYFRSISTHIARSISTRFLAQGRIDFKSNRRM
nr:MAG TPA: hypothetical protein [Caudoviricetes sp.]